MPAVEPESRGERGEYFNPKRRLSAEHSRAPHDVRATAGAREQRGEYRLYGSKALNALDFRSAPSARRTVPISQTVTAVSEKLHARRDYDSAAGNTDAHVRNTPLSLPSPEGRIVARIAAFTLLHQR